MKNKIVTFSFDDGIQYDKRFVELLNKYNLKCTFNINSGITIRSHTGNWTGKEIEIHRMTVDEMREVYNGHEIASHSLTHRHLEECPIEMVENEIREDIENLKSIFSLDGIPCFAYPYGTYSKDVIKVLEKYGIKFARVVSVSHNFDVPNNLLEYCPTIHYRDPNLFSIIDEFLAKNDEKKQILYIWGHSYEFEAFDEWEYIENVFKKLANRDDVDYLTNGEAFLNDSSGIYRKYLFSSNKINC